MHEKKCRSFSPKEKKKYFQTEDLIDRFSLYTQQKSKGVKMIKVGDSTLSVLA